MNVRSICDEERTCGGREAASKKPNALQRYFSMLDISTFLFSGGFLVVAFMKRKFAGALHRIDKQDMPDLTVLGESSPGDIAANAAMLVGSHRRIFQNAGR